LPSSFSRLSLKQKSNQARRLITLGTTNDIESRLPDEVAIRGIRPSPGPWLSSPSGLTFTHKSACWIQGVSIVVRRRIHRSPHSQALSPALRGHFRPQLWSAGERDVNFMDSPPRVAVAALPNPGLQVCRPYRAKNPSGWGFQAPLCPARKIRDITIVLRANRFI
jgi:hypothetical protein